MNTLISILLTMVFVLTCHAQSVLDIPDYENLSSKPTKKWT